MHPVSIDTLFANGNSVNFNGMNDSDQWNYADNKIIQITNPVGIRNISSIAKGFHLEQNYPNPFNPSTKIKFEIPSDVKSKTLKVKLIIYNITGSEIQTLINETLNPGSYEAMFDGSKLSSGVYYYKLSAGAYSQTKKMLMIK